MARTLIAYFCLLCLVEVCKSQVNIARNYPAYFLTQKTSLRQNDPEGSQRPDEKPSQGSGNSSQGSYYFTAKKTESVNDHCMCSQIYDPICGSNEKSYFNTCLMECEVGKNSNVTVLHQGNCIPF